MSSEFPSRRLRDIIENAELIAEYTEGMDLQAFENNSLVQNAVERCLERVCEAVSKLGEEAAILLPGQPWNRIRAFGNVLRHEYDRIESAQLWRVLKETLPSLVQACHASIRRLEELE
ncbi:MAG: DUF86 domain-containing protein [Acidobacteria bacterium]|nr:DUF86 domain-containing protein [Acidobacteriota bacterium]